MYDIEIDLPEEKEIFDDLNKLEIFRKHRVSANPTDLAILTGGDYVYDTFYNPRRQDYFLKGSRNTINREGKECKAYYYIGERGKLSSTYKLNGRQKSVRPILRVPDGIMKKLIEKSKDGILVKFGIYPQNAADNNTQILLENEYNKGSLKKTSLSFTFDKTNCAEENISFTPIKYKVYEFNNKKYIRLKPNNFSQEYTLIDERVGYSSKPIWIEVSPVYWYIDKKTNSLISRKCLLSGIRYDKQPFSDKFEQTEIYEFINKYMLQDLLQKININKYIDMTDDRLSILKDIIEDISEEDKEEYLKALYQLKDELSKPKKRK